MKKFISYLAVLIAILGSAIQAKAAYVPSEDEVLSAVKNGDLFFIRGDFINGTSGETLAAPRWFGVQYPKMSDDFVLNCHESAINPGDGYVFTVEEAEGTVGEYAGFYLKNVETGMYVKKSNVETGGTRDAKLLLTANKAEASVIAFRPANLMFENAPETAFQLITYAEDGATILLLNNNYDNQGNGTFYPRFATFTDGTTWFSLAPAVEGDEEEAVVNKLITLWFMVEEYYPLVGGEGPGTYSVELAEAFNKAFVECNVDDLFDQGATLQDLKDALARFEPLVVQVMAGPRELESGYYYVVSDMIWTVNPENLRAPYYNEGKLYWNTVDRNNPKFIWKLEKLEQKGMYSMYNYEAGMYVADFNNGGKMSDEIVPVNIKHLGGSQFHLIIDNNPMHCNGHGGGVNTSGSITGWNEGLNSPSAWHFEAVPQETIDQLKEAVEKQQKVVELQQELVALLNEVSAKTKSAFEYEVPADAVNVTPLSGEDFNSNAAMSAEHGWSWGNDGQGYGALVDDDPNTFFHTDWSGKMITSSSYDDEGNPTGTPTQLHNLSMLLTQPVSNVTFEVTPRGGGLYNNPVKIDVAVSKDGVNWTDIFYGYDFFTPTKRNDEPYLMGPFDLGDSYQYVRFANHGNDRDKKGHFFTFSELKVYEGVKLTETCQASTMDATVVSNFMQAYSGANKYAVDYTASDYDNIEAAIKNLQTAYAQFIGAFADPSALNESIAKAEEVINNFMIGNGQIGLYSDDADPTALNDAVASGKQVLVDGFYTQQQIADASKNIEDAIEDLNKNIIMPDPEKWYMFQFASDEEFETLKYGDGNGLQNFVCTVAQGYDAEEGMVVMPENLSDIRGNAGLYSAPMGVIENPDLYMFRFIPVEGGYVIQNKATGLYIQDLGWSAHAFVRNQAGLFKVAVLGAGFCVLESYNLYTGEGREPAVNTLHFANPAQYYEMRGWPDHALATKSCTKIIEMESVDVSSIGNEYITLAKDNYMAAVYNAGIDQYENVTPYEVKGQYQDEEGLWYVAMVPFETETIEAGQPVVFLGTSEEGVGSIHFDNTFTTTPVEGALIGVLNATSIEEGLVATLSNDGGTKWNTTNATSNYPVNVAGGSAYLDATLLELTFDEVENMYDVVSILLTKTTTGIKSVVGSTAQNSKVVYTVDGRRVATTDNLNGVKSGIYVVGGRKVYIK